MKGKKVLATFLAITMMIPSVQTVSGQVEAAKNTKMILQQDDRKEWNFNTNWLFIDKDDDAAKEIEYDEVQAEPVSLPHSLGEYDIFNPDPSE